MLKPNHKVGVSAITRVCSLVSSLLSSSFFIPEHLFASPLAFSRSISLFFVVFLAYQVGSVWEMCLFVSWKCFSPHKQRMKCEMGACKIARMHPSNTISGRQMHLGLCARCCQEIWTDYYVSEIQSNSGTEDQILFCTLIALNLGKITLYTSF